MSNLIISPGVIRVIQGILLTFLRKAGKVVFVRHYVYLGMTHMALLSDGYPILKQGASGPAVEVLQRRLNQRFAEFGAMAPFVKVNGVFDRYMTSMVKYLQCIAFLPMDGIVGLQTWDFLLNGVESLPILALGSCGAVVWQIQDMLRRLGNPTPVDGIFDIRLVNQVKHYQTLNDLPALGVVDRMTWTYLIKERVKTPRWFMVLSAA